MDILTIGHRRRALLFFLFYFLFSPAGAQKFVGGDISMLKEFQDQGAIYKDQDGKAIKALDLFQQEGWNAMRVRLFVDPSKASDDDKKEGAIQDLDYVIALCKDIQSAGFQLMLDFHYSDTWTDPGQHKTPAAWSSYDAAKMATVVYDYTCECLKKLADAGIKPAFIQPGNEITYGMLWPTGHIWPAGGGQDGGTWANFTSYLASGINACKEICPQAKIVIQTEMSKSDNVTSFYNELSKYKSISYDIIGLSYYPDYHGSLAVLNNTLSTLEKNHPDKKIMIVETGYGFEWQLPGAKYNFASTWPVTESGQQKFTTDLIAALASHPNVNGLFWWYPEYTLNNIVFKDGAEDWSKNFTNGYWNAALFHYKTGKALKALYSLKDFLDKSSGIADMHADRQADGHWYTLDGRRLQAKPGRQGIYITNGRKVVIR